MKSNSYSFEADVSQGVNSGWLETLPRYITCRAQTGKFS